MLGLDKSERMAFAKVIMLLLGILSIGVGAGFAISLQWMQDAAIAQGALPAPGTLVAGDMWTNTPIYQTAGTMQTVANGAGIVGGMLVLGYGILNEYGGATE